MQNYASEKTEKSLGEVLIMVVCIGLMMMAFIFYFFKQEPILKSTGFNALKNSFSENVRAIHANWMMDKQPNIVKVQLNLLGTNETESYFVPVNKRGWVDSDNEYVACQEIWEFVMRSPLEFINSPISAIEVRDDQQTFGKRCQYSLPSGEFFEYNSQNGHIGDIKLH